jgi:hypothetical protein
MAKSTFAKDLLQTNDRLVRYAQRIVALLSPSHPTRIQRTDEDCVKEALHETLLPLPQVIGVPRIRQDITGLPEL